MKSDQIKRWRYKIRDGNRKMKISFAFPLAPFKINLFDDSTEFLVVQ